LRFIKYSQANTRIMQLRDKNTYTHIHSHTKGTWEIHTRHSENPERINYIEDLNIEGRI